MRSSTASLEAVKVPMRKPENDASRALIVDDEVSSEALDRHLQSALKREGDPTNGDGREMSSDG